MVLGDFEGTINPDYPLSGYPLFNAPQSVTAAIKDADRKSVVLGKYCNFDTINILDEQWPRVELDG